MDGAEVASCSPDCCASLLFNRSSRLNLVAGVPRVTKEGPWHCVFAEGRGPGQGHRWVPRTAWDRDRNQPSGPCP